MVLSIQKQQIKCEEHTFPPAKQQVIEDRTPAIIDTRNLAIDNSILNAKVLTDPLREGLKVAERVSIARDKFALAVLDVGEGTEPIDFQFEDVIVGVEGLRAAGEADGP